MNYNFPPTSFSTSNSISEQVDHVLSEARELAAHGGLVCREAMLEVMDLLHSVETLLRIVERTCGEDYVDGLVVETISKNAMRKYYDGQRD